MESLCKFISLFIVVNFCSCTQDDLKQVHVFEIQEIVLTAEKNYENPYTDVECWVQLNGPEFNKRIYGFWDGEQTFKVRVVAIKSGKWSWTSGSNSVEDQGLNGKTGSFTALAWTEQEKEENPNRRGFIHSTSNGHALQYADETPFFFIGVTWWAASTWRYPLLNKTPDPDWIPGPENFSFENLIHYRKKQGYNSIGIIAGYPNWAADEFSHTLVDEQGIGIRQAWEKSTSGTAKDMHDELGNRPFELSDKPPMANFDKINPAYFKSIDKKMDYLDSVGFVPFFETVRRDHGPSWKAYFDWPGSFTRYVQYIVARYGAYNIIFSPIHLDWIPRIHSLSAEEFNEAIVSWHNEYGSLPYEQPVTLLIDEATHRSLGPGNDISWLTMHSVGNSPRDHGFYPMLEEQFHFEPPLPTANLEAYYPGWEYPGVAGEVAKRNTDRDNYFGRTQAWGSVFSGGLAGHIYGTGAYDGNTVGEDEGERPTIWEALQYPAGEQVGFLSRFLDTKTSVYQNLQLASDDLHPRKSKDSQPNGLDGWAFMMRLPDKKLAKLYFENKCTIPKISGMLPGSEYELKWFDPVSGQWLNDSSIITSDEKGIVTLEAFPDGNKKSMKDWSLEIQLKQ